MSSIYRIFIRHEMETQPTWFKLRSDLAHDDLVADIHQAMQQPAPSLLRFTDLDDHIWIFRADKIYTVCVYPPEEDPSAESEEGSSDEGAKEEASGEGESADS